MWVVREGVLKLCDADVLFLMFPAMLASAFRLLAHPAGGTVNEMVDALASVHRFRVLEVRLMSVEIEVSLPHRWGRRCRSSRCIHSLSNPCC